MAGNIAPGGSLLPGKLRNGAQGRFRKWDKVFRLSIEDVRARRPGVLLLRPAAERALRGIALEIPCSKDPWTGSPHDGPARFRATIKAAAAALFLEGLRGTFRIGAKDTTVEIRKK